MKRPAWAGQQDPALWWPSNHIEALTLTTICSRCGSNITAESAFCSSCGNNLSGDAGAPSSASTSPDVQRLAAVLAPHYRVVREVGRGGMATVYLAEDVRHDRKVAIKVLHPDLAASVGEERFEREIKVAGALQHPNILGLYDSGVADGLLYYVMPFVEGESLRSRLDREGQLPLEDAILICVEVASALGYAHSKGIIHRDIKPENILLDNGRSLVADFGIARTVIEGQQKLTQTGMAVGTPAYMSPEQASGDKVGPTADIYALACVLYEMLAGEPPFTGKNSMMLRARHAMEQVPSIRIVRPSVPEEVEHAIFRAMEKVPADRPQSCAEFTELFAPGVGYDARLTPSRGTLMRTPTLTRRIPTLAYRTVAAPKPWRKRTSAIAVVATLVLALALGARQFTVRRHAALVDDPNARRLAVLYFKDNSTDHSLRPLADGLTEGLMTALGTVPSLTVISKGGVEPYRDSDVEPDSIARMVRAGYVVRGSIEPQGADRVKVNVFLDGSGATLQRTSFTAPAGNTVAMRDTLTAIASSFVRKELGREFAVREQRAATTSDAAWMLVQRADQARRQAEAAFSANDAAAMAAGFAAADSLLALAEIQDPRWAEPIVRRAQIAYRRSRIDERDLPLLRRWIGTGLAHASRAIAVDPGNADAFEVRGNLNYWAWLKGLEADKVRADALIRTAAADLDKATTLNPRQAGAWASLSHLNNNLVGRTSTDVQLAAQRALEADEFLANAEVVLNRLFLSSYDLAQFDRAEQWCTETQRRFPAGVNALRCQLFLLTGRGRDPNVTRAWHLADSVVARTAAARQPYQRLNADMLVAVVLARASKTTPALADSARHVARRSEGDAAIDPTRELAQFGAFVYALLGDNDRAIRLLTEYLAVNPQRLQAFRDEGSWWYRGLESDPRYKQLVGTE